ncbi:MAG: asparagine synthase (glutamine-hydrolyzing), partial [Candidatus Polarisedimenticolia bacterium]
MCGLAGIAWRDPGRVPDAELLRAMGDAVAHRGPDDAAERAGPGFGLASRRLAILDLSPAGRMPMASDDGRVILA